MKNSINIVNNHLGKALTASRNISIGESFLKISGNFLRNPSQLASCSMPSHLIQVGQSLYYDPAPPARYINHSCDPNCILSGTNIISIKEINIGSELTFDYSTTMDEDSYTLSCLCGTNICRGIIKDFYTLPKNIKQKYIELGGVQMFILQKYSNNV